MEHTTTTIIAVRHGETEWNKQGKQQGHLNSCLTRIGQQQAILLAQRLKNESIDMIFSSDLDRAYSTAKFISDEIKVGIKTDKRLRERNLGILQGMSKQQFKEKYPNHAEKFESGDPDYVIPDGESIKERHERCVNCAQEIANENKGKKILIVSHGGVLISFFHKALNIPLNHPRCFSLYNASYNSFLVMNGTWFLENWGDINHLKDTGTIDDD